MNEIRKNNSHKKNFSLKSILNICLGMYENDVDREGLRQMLSGLRRDPMEVNRILG